MNNTAPSSSTPLLPFSFAMERLLADMDIDLSTTPIFLPALLTLCAAYPALAPHFPAERQRAWILTTLASSLMTLSSLPFVADYFSHGGIAGVLARAALAVAVNRFFQAYLVADMLLGALCYRAQINFLTGWVHHVVYVGITELAVRRGWAHVFCLCAVMELPTFLLGLSTLIPRLRSNALFALAFFATRIVFHVVLMVECALAPVVSSSASTPSLSLSTPTSDLATSTFGGAISIAPHLAENGVILGTMEAWNRYLSARLPALLLALVFPLHAMWFRGCVAGFIRRYRLSHPSSPTASPTLAVKVEPHPLTPDIHPDARSLLRHSSPPLALPLPPSLQHAAPWPDRLHRLRAWVSASDPERWLSGGFGYGMGLRELRERVKHRRPIRPRAAVMARRMSASLMGGAGVVVGPHALRDDVVPLATPYTESASECGERCFSAFHSPQHDSIPPTIPVNFSLVPLKPEHVCPYRIRKENIWGPDAMEFRRADRSPTRTGTSGIFVVMRGLVDLAAYKAVPAAAFPDIWARVWPWIEFQDEYRDYVPGIDLLPETERYSLYMALLDFLGGNALENRLTDTTVGSYVVAGRAWRCLIHAEEDRGFDHVCHFLAAGLLRSDKWDPRPFEELVMGAGGTWRDLAWLVVTHIERVIPRVIADHTVHHLGAILHLAGNIREGEWNPAFQSALLAEGIVTALTTASLGLSSSPLAAVEMELGFKGIALGLTTHLISNPRHRWIAESLRAGLLPTAFSTGAARHEENVGLWLRELLEDILPAATVYHSVLSELRVSLAAVGDRDATASFDDPAMLEHWKNLVELVDERLQVVDLHTAGSLEVTRVCDHTECDREASEMRQYKRCSGCRTSYYCSQRCQIIDWRYGGHRHRCRQLALRRNRDSCISAKDRSFMRALVHHDYTANREQIALDQLLHMRENPAEIPCTMFDYTEGYCAIYLLSHGELDAEFSADAARAEAWGGRMQLHLVKVVEGEDSSRTWSIPLRSADAELVRGLRSIAESLPSDTTEDDLEQYRPRIQALLDLRTLTTH
ncbi:hypothetical protein C8R47DRAFT_1225248 [Mycena vitilis]|nr:hypothetical protein C8R47DRAFT_1225248 [Mycena vitilis]